MMNLGTPIRKFAKFYLSDWKIVEIPRDGNSLFRALSYSIYGSENEHLVVRSKIVDSVVKNWETYSSLVVDDSLHSVWVNDKKDYVKVMSQIGTIGGQVELTAAVNIFNIFVHLYDTNSGSVTRIGYDSKRKMEINLIYEGNGRNVHYNVLIKKGTKQKRRERDHNRYQEKKRKIELESIDKQLLIKESFELDKNSILCVSRRVEETTNSAHTIKAEEKAKDMVVKTEAADDPDEYIAEVKSEPYESCGEEKQEDPLAIKEDISWSVGGKEMCEHCGYTSDSKLEMELHQGVSHGESASPREMSL